MPTGAPPPYAGEKCRNDGDGAEHDLDLTRAGSYYGLCGVCRPLEAERRRHGRPRKPPAADLREDFDGMADDLRAAARRPSLKGACEELVDRAERLEEALEGRNQARMRASVALGEFKETLTLVGRVAQSLVNQRIERAGGSG